LIVSILPVSSYAETQPAQVIVKSSAVNYYRFFKTGETTLKTDGSPLKVSADMKGPGKLSASYAKSVTAAFSSTLATANQSMITASVSGSYGYTLTTTIGYTLDVASGRIGYIAFQPYKIKVTGNLKYYSSLYPTTPISTTAVYAKYPKKTSAGEFDGLYYIKYI
jgi:hypothetical protein